MSTKSPNTASKAVGAGAWTVGTRLTAKLIDLAMLLCLARFLGPAEFGLVAMAMAVVFIVEALFELPLGAALIRVSELTSDLLHTAFTLSLLRGIVIALLLLALAWPLAAFNDEPRLFGLLAVLALAPALRGLVSPRMVEYARAFNFRPDAAMELSGKAVAFTVAVAIAASTRSYWAIAAATVCGPLVSTLLSYYIAPLRLRLTLVHWAHFSSLIGWNFLSQLSAALNWQIDRLLLPRLTTDTAFGQYAMGKQMSEIPMQALVAPLARPALAALASSGNTSGNGHASRYLQLSHAIALLLIPVMGVPLLWPDVLVRVALGPAWVLAAEWVRWLSAVALLGLPAVLMGALAMTLNRNRWVAVRTFVELLVRLPLVWAGAVYFGIPGAIAGSAIATATGTLTALYIVRRLIGTGVAQQVMALWRPMVAMLPAGAVLWVARPKLMATTGLGEMLMAAVPVGLLYLLVYALAVLAAWRLAGRPAGLERHLVDAILNRFKQSIHPMESHGTQPQ
ncbi:lipopolysaccharide biosynthesis protein [soil metagenome]